MWTHKKNKKTYRHRNYPIWGDRFGPYYYDYKNTIMWTNYSRRFCSPVLGRNLRDALHMSARSPNLHAADPVSSKQSSPCPPSPAKPLPYLLFWAASSSSLMPRCYQALPNKNANKNKGSGLEEVMVNLSHTGVSSFKYSVCLCFLNLQRFHDNIKIQRFFLTAIYNFSSFK